MKRTLTLKREPLASLTQVELSAVAGAQAITGQGVTCPLAGLTCFGPFPSWDPPSCACETYQC